MKIFLLSGFILSTTFTCFGQGMNRIAPLGALPMEYNGSFAGQAGSPRLSSSFGIFGEGIPSKFHYSGSSISYDQFVPALRSGIGLSVCNYTMTLGNKAQTFHNPRPGYNPDASSKVHSQIVSLVVAPKISFSGKYTLSPSLNINYHNVTSRNLPFERSADLDRAFLSSNASLLFNTDKYYIGYSVVAYNNDSLLRNNSFQSYLQMGYTFRKSEESKFSFTPQLAFRVSNEYYFNPGRANYQDLLSAVNFNFIYKKTSWGFNNTGLHIGWQNNNFKIMAGGLIKNGFFGPQYSGNISMRYVFNNNRRILY